MAEVLLICKLFNAGVFGSQSVRLRRTTRRTTENTKKRKKVALLWNGSSYDSREKRTQGIAFGN